MIPPVSPTTTVYAVTDDPVAGFTSVETVDYRVEAGGSSRTATQSAGRDTSGEDPVHYNTRSTSQAEIGLEATGSRTTGLGADAPSDSHEGTTRNVSTVGAKTVTVATSQGQRAAETATFDEAITQLYGYEDQTTDGFAKRVTSSSTREMAALSYGPDGELGEVPEEPEGDEFEGQHVLTGGGADFYEKVTTRFTESPLTEGPNVSTSDGTYEQRQSARSTDNTSVGYGAEGNSQHKSSSTSSRQGSGAFSGGASSGTEEQQGRGSVSDTANTKSRDNGAVSSSSGYSRGSQRMQSSGDSRGGAGKTAGAAAEGGRGMSASTTKKGDVVTTVTSTGSSSAKSKQSGTGESTADGAASGAGTTASQGENTGTTTVTTSGGGALSSLSTTQFGKGRTGGSGTFMSTPGDASVESKGSDQSEGKTTTEWKDVAFGGGSWGQWLGKCFRSGSPRLPPHDCRSRD